MGTKRCVQIHGDTMNTVLQGDRKEKTQRGVTNKHETRNLSRGYRQKLENEKRNRNRSKRKDRKKKQKTGQKSSTQSTSLLVLINPVNVVLEMFCDLLPLDFLGSRHESAFWCPFLRGEDHGLEHLHRLEVVLLAEDVAFFHDGFLDFRVVAECCQITLGIDTGQ